MTDYDTFEQKRVQCVKGSYYVYLPITWCKKYDIDEKRKVFLKVLEDDSLLIRFDTKNMLNKDPYHINLDQDPKLKSNTSKDEYYDYIFNLYLTAYIIGYRDIIFEKRNKIPMRLQNRISEMTRRLHGMVVTSETQNKIVVSDTSSSLDIKLIVRQIINKVGLLMANFIELVENVIELDEADIKMEIEELITQDDQIDEHRYSIERSVHQIMQFPTLGYDIGITTVEALHYSECSRQIERIGDYITKLAKLLASDPIQDKSFVIKELHKMQETYHTIQDYFDRNDSLKFYSLIKEIEAYSEYSKTLINQSNPDSEYLTFIRRVKNLCQDIAEIRINNILSREQAKSKSSPNFSLL